MFRPARTLSCASGDSFRQKVQEDVFRKDILHAVMLAQSGGVVSFEVVRFCLLLPFMDITFPDCERTTIEISRALHRLRL